MNRIKLTHFHLFYALGIFLTAVGIVLALFLSLKSMGTHPDVAIDRFMGIFIIMSWFCGLGIAIIFATYVRLREIESEGVSIKVPGFVEGLFSWKGRINRSVLWLVFFIIISAVVVILVSFIILFVLFDIDGGIFLPMVAIFLHIPVMIIWILAIIKRFHDINMSGAWFVGLFVPLLGLLLFLLLFLLKGTGGSNRFGEDPLVGL
ncbi:MAG: DUF805 domain-containing protein [Candidatus Saganbacteria bacterium]|nr:DUF805 domain-containing protein [Candidatus Saganbacteria bacterium]